MLFAVSQALAQVALGARQVEPQDRRGGEIGERATGRFVQLVLQCERGTLSRPDERAADFRRFIDRSPTGRP
jgi:hypothetical protein